MKLPNFVYTASKWATGWVAWIRGRSSKYDDLRASEGHSCVTCTVIAWFGLLFLLILAAMMIITIETGKALLRVEDRWYRWRNGIVKEVDDEC